MTINVSVSMLSCFCENHCPDNKPNGTCYTVGDGRCFAQIEELTPNGGETKITRGCTPPETGSVFQCKAKKHYFRKEIQCCDTTMCNINLHPQLPPREIFETSENSFTPGGVFYLTAIICTVLLSFTIIVAAIITFYLSWRRKNAAKQVSLLGGLGSNKKPTDSNLYKHPIASIALDRNPALYTLGNNSTTRPEGAPGISTLQALTDSSGSGKGMPLLVQMTISRQFNLVKQIGEGGFGSVWKATWYGDPIAVKIFSTREEESWKREKEIYQTNLLRHDNILGFIAADIGGTGCSTQMLLIMEYHEYGSLYDFLQNRTLDVSLMLRLMYSILAGVNHLHNEIVGSEGKEQGDNRRSQRKPPIAHRDLKSKNILVKNNLTCCIADLGHCARYLWEENRIDTGHQQAGLVGTKRYMSPEVVADCMDRTRFEAYKACDMYNLSLVLWEIGRCTANTVSGVTASAYCYPFHDVLPNDPSVQDVYQVVCVNKMRPPIPPIWSRDPVFKTISRIIMECWTEDWQARHSALRVKKTLSTLMEENQRNVMSNLQLEMKKAAQFEDKNIEQRGMHYTETIA